MIHFSHKLLSELEVELQTIAFDYDDPIVKCEKSIQTTAKALVEVKSFVLEKGFDSTEDEILFFKTIKPKFTSKLIYFKKVRNLESRKPLGSRRIIREYLDSELNKLNNYFTENMEFYNYYRMGNNFLDPKIFTRNNTEISYNLEYFYFELDHRFATTHDYKVRAIIGNEIFQNYIENKIVSLSNKETRDVRTTKELPALKWTDSKIGLIELIYALYSQKAFNNGKADIIDIAKHFEIVFDTKLDDIYSVFSKMKSEKKNKTKYLSILITNFRKLFED